MSGAITGSRSLPKTNAPYRFSDVRTTSGCDTEVATQPGTVLTFGAGAGLLVNGGTGSATDPVDHESPAADDVFSANAEGALDP